MYYLQVSLTERQNHNVTDNVRMKPNMHSGSMLQPYWLNVACNWQLIATGARISRFLYRKTLFIANSAIHAHKNDTYYTTAIGRSLPQGDSLETYSSSTVLSRREYYTKQQDPGRQGCNSRETQMHIWTEL